jgi:DNA repair exonuclease SbcCD ATPase subunit
MNYISFDEVGMTNFGPYTSLMTLTFDSNKLIVITGPNGIGKTMLLDSIPFTLYGLTSKGAKGDDVVNNTTKKDCFTYLNFHTDNATYRVERYQKYKGYGNTVLLFKDDMTTPIKKGQKEVLPEIEKIIAPRKLFMNTLMFGQKVKDFFTDLSDTDKKEIFRKILDADNYIMYYDQTKKEISLIQLSLSKVQEDINVKIKLRIENEIAITEAEENLSSFQINKDLAIEALKSELEEIQKSIDNENQALETISKDIDIELETKQRELTELNLKITGIEEEEKTKLTEVELQRDQVIQQQNQKVRDLCQTISDEARKEIDTIKVSYDEKTSEIRTLITTITKSIGEFQSEVSSRIATKKSLSDTIQEINDNVFSTEISTCPTCKQDIDEKTISDLQQKVQEFQNQIENIITEIEWYNAKITTHDNEINKNQQLLNSLKVDFDKQCAIINANRDSKIQELNDKFKKYQIDIDNTLREKTKKIRDSFIEQKEDLMELFHSTTELVKNLQSEIQRRQTIQNKIIQFQENLKNIQNHIEQKSIEEPIQIESQIQRLKQRDIDLSNEIEKAEVQQDDLTKKLEILEFWKTAFSSSGIPSMLIDESIPFMNSRVAEYLDLISGGRYLVTYDTLSATKKGELRDKIQVNMFDQETKSLGRIQFSGGQIRIVDIATILTLCDLQSHIRNISFNIILFDEIFDSLDEDNTMLVSKVLRSLVKNKTVCIISHRNIEQIDADEMLNLR